MAENTSTTFRVSNKKPAQHQAFSHNFSPPEDMIKYLRMYVQTESNKFSEILQMSNFPANAKLKFCENGFVETVLDAYNEHHNLIIRPDDVWGAIMTQFSFYVNKHAEEFRGQFVDFQGQKTLKVPTLWSLRNSPYDLLVKLMSKEIDRNLIDPEVKQWILPSFSTTTDNDLVTVGVIFMATMKKYFKYSFCLTCGIPSVTLEGTLNDWENLLGRLEKLKEYKLQKWFDMLKPIFQQFVNCKRGKVDVSFWQKIAHYEELGSGPRYISGWITAFCVFDEDGDWQGSRSRLGQGCTLWKPKWPVINTDDIPSGVVQVVVKINDNGVDRDSVMLAGHVATEIKGNNGDTVQPTMGWIIALKSDTKDKNDENDVFSD